MLYILIYQTIAAFLEVASAAVAGGCGGGGDVAGGGGGVVDLVILRGPREVRLANSVEIEVVSEALESVGGC